MDVLADTGPMQSFITRVQQLAELSDRDETERVIHGTLGTLAETITGGQMGDLAPVLPVELRPDIAESRGQARPFDKGAFLDRVTGHIDTVDIDTAETQVRAVLQTGYEWALAGEIDDTLAQLPPDLAAMFQ